MTNCNTDARAKKNDDYSVHLSRCQSISRKSTDCNDDAHANSPIANCKLWLYKQVSLQNIQNIYFGKKGMSFLFVICGSITGRQKNFLGRKNFVSTNFFGLKKFSSSLLELLIAAKKHI